MEENETFQMSCADIEFLLKSKKTLLIHNLKRVLKECYEEPLVKFIQEWEGKGDQVSVLSFLITMGVDLEELTADGKGSQELFNLYRDKFQGEMVRMLLLITHTEVESELGKSIKN